MDPSLKMPAWFLLYCFVFFGSCEGFLFNVSRGAQGIGSDLFSNMDPSATCPRRNDDGRSWCVAKNADCSHQGCCICACKYSHSTFRMRSSLSASNCAENEDIRKFAGCTQTFASVSKQHPLVTLDLSGKGSKGIPHLPDKCKIKSAQYLDQGAWRYLRGREEDTFDIGDTGLSWPSQELTWDGKMPSSYFGYVMKVNAECGKGHRKKRFCVVFKAKGTRTWNVPDPTTKTPPAVVTTISTTSKTPTTATKVTTQVKSTREVMSTTTASVKTTAATKGPTSKKMTTKTIATKPSPKPSKVTNSSSESPTATPASLQTELVTEEVWTTEATGYKPGSKERNKGENKFSSEKEKDNSTMIAIIAGVAAVICLAIALLCIWLIVSQRRKNRDSANYGAGTTVIANLTTRSQNHFPMPGLLKNPVFDDSVYAEPDDRAKRAASGNTGNPSNDNTEDLLLKNPRARDGRSIPLNNIRLKPRNTASRKTHRENTYDSTERYARDKVDGGKPMYHNPGCVLDGDKPAYQSLMKEDASARFNSESNLGMYQSLDQDRLMYQPLQKNNTHKDEIPEYLALLNPDENPRTISPSPPEYQPPYSTGPPPADIKEPPEYADYADLDELEEIKAIESLTTCSDQGPSYEAPLYNVLEGPSYDYACPGAVMHDVLEGPYPDSTGITNQGFEPPMYAVLEGPDTTS